MGEFQLRLTSQAARDLRNIVSYIARDNPVAAERFGIALVEKAELLKSFPMLGKRVKGTEEHRVLVHAPILIFYRRGHYRQALLARCAKSAAHVAAPIHLPKNRSAQLLPGVPRLRHLVWRPNRSKLSPLQLHCPRAAKNSSKFNLTPLVSLLAGVSST